MKLKKLSTLKEEAQKSVNKFIRLRDCLYTTGTTYQCVCISCLKTKLADDIQAGHFVAQKSSSNLRYREKNINGQCEGCNCFQKGNLIPYTINIDKKYHSGTAEQLQAERRKEKIWKRWELEEIKTKYDEKYQKLLEHGLDYKEAFKGMKPYEEVKRTYEEVNGELQMQLQSMDRDRS